MEQIKAAIEKARAERNSRTGATRAAATPFAQDASDTLVQDRIQDTKSANGAAPSTGASAKGDDAQKEIAARWAALAEYPLDARRLKRNRIVTHDSSDRTHVSFDLMRTRLRKMIARTGWTRIGITSPQPRCGKSVISTNLAFAMARHDETRVILYDFDMKSPQLAKIFGNTVPRNLGGWLSGELSYKDHFVRCGDRLAVAFNTDRIFHGAEAVENAATAAALHQVEEELAPNVEIFDLGPLLSTDDSFAMLSRIDCVILVAAAGETRPEDVIECERLIGDQTNYVGVLLNKLTLMPTEREYY